MDPYELCPCGSRKKIKFCCHALYGEMEKVSRLQENNQPRMALQMLEKLDKAHPDNPWVVTRTAMLLLSEGHATEAESILRTFLRKHQDHTFANVLYGIAAYGASGYPEAKRAIHRAFRFGSADAPEFVASLATDVGLTSLRQGHLLSARQHLALALRWNDPEQRKTTFRAIYDLDGNQSIPFVFRGPQPLPAWTPPAELQEALVRAQQLSSIGCWHEAAEHLSGTAGESAPAELYHTIGLYRAWDGAHAAAAAALHQAAAAYADFETAVECETLAQLLDSNVATMGVPQLAHQFQVLSVARLLTQLDEMPRLMRVPVMEEEREATGGAMTRYMVLDREHPEDPATLSLATAPRALGAFTVFSLNGEGGGPAGLAIWSAPEGAASDSIIELFRAAAGDTINPEARVEQLPTSPAELECSDLFEPLYFDERARNPDVVRVIQEQWDHALREKWPQSPQPALGGRSPADAAGVADLRVALAAAINVLDVGCAQRGIILDVAALRSQLQLPEITKLQAEEGTNLSMLSFAQCLRIDLPPLTPHQLEHLTQRALLMRHPGFAHATLTHVVAREDVGDNATRQMYYLVLSQICDDSHRSDESLRWIAQGQATVPEGPQRFEQLARWKMRELTTRSNLEPGPELDAVLVELWHTFGPKLPGLREMLVQTAQSLGIAAPWETAIMTASDLSAATSEAWSPVGATASGGGGGEKKLWLPGDR